MWGETGSGGGLGGVEESPVRADSEAAVAEGGAFAGAEAEGVAVDRGGGVGGEESLGVGLCGLSAGRDE